MHAFLLDVLELFLWQLLMKHNFFISFEDVCEFSFKCHTTILLPVAYLLEVISEFYGLNSIVFDKTIF